MNTLLFQIEQWVCLLSNVLVLGMVLGRTKSGRIVGVANHQMQMSRCDHHTAINFLQLNFTLVREGI